MNTLINMRKIHCCYLLRRSDNETNSYKHIAAKFSLLKPAFKKGNINVYQFQSALDTSCLFTLILLSYFAAYHADEKHSLNHIPVSIRTKPSKAETSTYVFQFGCSPFT